MKVLALQILFQDITLEKGLKIIMNTIGADFVRSPASVWKHILHRICIFCFDCFVAYRFLQVLPQHHTVSLSLSSNGTRKIQTREGKPIKNWHYASIDLSAEECFSTTLCRPVASFFTF